MHITTMASRITKKNLEVMLALLPAEFSTTPSADLIGGYVVINVPRRRPMPGPGIRREHRGGAGVFGLTLLNDYFSKDDFNCVWTFTKKEVHGEFGEVDMKPTPKSKPRKIRAGRLGIAYDQFCEEE